MTKFIRLLGDNDKATGLASAVKSYRQQQRDERLLSVASATFTEVPGAPFAYWVSEKVRSTFKQMVPFGAAPRAIKQGLATADDFRFVRTWWESYNFQQKNRWYSFAKGGAFASYYADIYLIVNWECDGKEISHNLNEQGKMRSNLWMLKDSANRYFYKYGLTWSDRTTKGFSARVWPAGGVFSVKGSAGFFSGQEFFAVGVMNSMAFNALLSLLVGAGDAAARSYQVGLIGIVPYPQYDMKVEELAHRSWSLKRTLDTVNEISHAFLLPVAIRDRVGEYQPVAIEEELAKLQQQIDDIVFELYGLDEEDRRDLERWANKGNTDSAEAEAENEADADSDDGEAVVDHQTSLLSWCVGVAFGRFDWRLATGERAAPVEPEPFDQLPAKSPGMLPDGAAPFNANAGILVDDAGHPHDLPHWVEEVLMRVRMPVPHDLRNWLQREFFAAHLQQYSKSRRKAPIYWPLSTASGSYTLWLYYPSLTNQTLYTCVNDFLEPKLKQVGGELANLRCKGSKRSLSDEKQFEKLQAFELELTELRDTLLKIAPRYHPNQDDGVQITAAPLWSLFRHKPWQKVLKETWAKLEKGDYDWAHLAMQYWPERVRVKCKTDKSLAIAHSQEDLYVEPVAATKKNTKK